MPAATVLIIDSDADSVAIYSLLLRHHGYEVLHAYDAETGLRVAFERSPDLVVSDLVLPPIVADAIVEQLRSDFRTAATPLIILDSAPTIARDLTERYQRLSRLTKPCEPSRLLQEIERLLGKRLPLAH
jgi:CheY-like chemotaxis protein